MINVQKRQREELSRVIVTNCISLFYIVSTPGCWSNGKTIRAFKMYCSSLCIILYDYIIRSKLCIASDDT